MGVQTAEWGERTANEREWSRKGASAFAKKLRRDKSARQEREKLHYDTRAGLHGFTRIFEMSLDGTKAWAGE
jgi:hypothetical protein